MMDGVKLDPLVLWHVSGRDAYGKPVFLAPKNISGRWEDATEEFIDSTNLKCLSRAVIDIFGSGVTVTVGDMICSGAIYQLPSGASGSPQTYSGAVIVKQVQPCRDFERRETGRTLFV